jgi:hypothetical protein
MPYYEDRALVYGFIADRRYEAELMTCVADARSARARNGIAWGVSSEEAEVVKCCPYQTGTRRYGS